MSLRWYPSRLSRGERHFTLLVAHDELSVEGGQSHHHTVWVAVRCGSIAGRVTVFEDSDALVLRLYEAHGARGTARVRLGLPFESARLANALEDDGEPVAVDGDELELRYRPHQLLTVKVR